MMDVIFALIATWPLWAFIGIMGVSLLVEEGIIALNKRKLVDNPALW